jgi:hypothetical protein
LRERRLDSVGDEMIGKDGGTEDRFAGAAMEGFGAFILGRNMFAPAGDDWGGPCWKGWWAGRLYAFFATYFQFELKEGDAWADLRMLEDQPPPSPALDVRLRSAIKQARMSRWTIQRLHTQVMLFAAQSGIQPEPTGNLEVQAVCLPLQTPPGPRRCERSRLAAGTRATMTSLENLDAERNRRWKPTSQASLQALTNDRFWRKADIE